MIQRATYQRAKKRMRSIRLYTTYLSSASSVHSATTRIVSTLKNFGIGFELVDLVKNRSSFLREKKSNFSL